MDKKILIIDDNETHRMIYRTQLENFLGSPVTVIEADNIEDGMKLIITETPDAIVLDHAIPGGTGLQLINQLRIAMPDHAPIILLSANMDESLRRNAMALGAAVCMEKSTMGKGELVDAITEAME